jgi:hypothetical protein
MNMKEMIEVARKKYACDSDVSLVVEHGACFPGDGDFEHVIEIKVCRGGRGTVVAVGAGSTEEEAIKMVYNDMCVNGTLLRKVRESQME